MLQSSQNLGPKVMKIIWAALLGSQILYGSLLPTIIQENEPQELNIPIVIALSVMALLMCILAFVISKWIFKMAKNQILKDHGERPNYSMETLIPYYQTGFILRLAMIESCALMGFALAVMHKRMELYYPFVALSVGLYLMNFPTEEKVRSALK